MKRPLLICLLALACCVALSQQLTCATCRGDECNRKLVRLVQCGPAEPLRYLPDVDGTALVNADANFGCLDIQYFEDDKLTRTKQCVVTAAADICEQYLASDQVQSCFFETAALRIENVEDRIKADVAEEAEDPAVTTTTEDPNSDEPDITEPSTPTTTTTTSAPTDPPTEPPAPGSAASLNLSVFCIFVVLLAKLSSL